MSETATDGREYLSGLEKYWPKLAVPKVRPISSEALIVITDEHWIKYVFPSFLYVALTMASIFFFAVSAFTDRYEPALALPVILMSLVVFWCVQHWFFWFLLAESESRIIVTSKRVLHISSGLLWGEETVEIAFDKMKTVEAHKKTLLQSILNYGTLQFEPFKITCVPHPGTVAKLIQQSMGMV